MPRTSASCAVAAARARRREVVLENSKSRHQPRESLLCYFAPVPGHPACARARPHVRRGGGECRAASSRAAFIIVPEPVCVPRGARAPSLQAGGAGPECQASGTMISRRTEASDARSRQPSGAVILPYGASTPRSQAAEICDPAGGPFGPRCRRPSQGASVLAWWRRLTRGLRRRLAGSTARQGAAPRGSCEVRFARLLQAAWITYTCRRDSRGPANCFRSPHCSRCEYGPRPARRAKRRHHIASVGALMACSGTADGIDYAAWSSRVLTQPVVAAAPHATPALLSGMRVWDAASCR